MIESLTQAQIDRMPEFVEKWTAIGLCTDPADRPAAEEGVREAYRIAGLEPPKQIVWCGSPMAIANSAIDSQNVWQSVGQNVWQSVGQSVRASVREGVGESVRQGVPQSVRASVWQSVRHSVYGQHEAWWLSYYDFFREVCGLREQTEPLAGLTAIAKSAGWVLPYEGICWISERHNVLRRNAAGRLHCDGGPAIRYPDGWSIWALNGVVVSQEIAETPAEKLDPQRIFSEENVEIRREIVRKIGVERLMHKLGSTLLEKDGDYELHTVPIGTDRTCTALKMLNPSVPELWHVEFVPPTCTTVQDALNFRNGLTPEQIDDVNGADWQQQGDVIIRPRGATKFKSRPISLT